MILFCRFVPNRKASGAISEIIKAQFEQPWTTWTVIPEEVRDRWFSEFKVISFFIIANAFVLMDINCIF